tara:strand:+ start:215 stop:466 length:252 start_codon:yes stop_codon:yes gene_type:complete
MMSDDILKDATSFNGTNVRSSAAAAAAVAMETAKEVRGKLNTHEAVCSERWKETIERIKRLELIMIASAGAVIVLMAGMLWKI